jgi:hypothetical protein
VPMYLANVYWGLVPFEKNTFCIIIRLNVESNIFVCRQAVIDNDLTGIIFALYFSPFWFIPPKKYTYSSLRASAATAIFCWLFSDEIDSFQS